MSLRARNERGNLIIFALFFFIFIFPPFLPREVKAQGEFSTAYDVSYKYNENGNAYVEQKINLTNLKDNLYASEYAITIGDKSVTNVTAFDNKGPLSPDVTSTDHETTIHITFNEQTVGVGKKVYFGINYMILSSAKKLGRIWQVIIPRVEKDNFLTSYNVTVVVPKSYGLLSYAKPKPASGLIWNLNQLAKTGIEMAFGDYGVFDFNLTYHLKNPEDRVIETEIAIPMDSTTQKIFLSRMTPPPKNIEIDSDGNWMAKYDMNPGQLLSVLATGQAVIFSKYRDESRTKLTAEQRGKYTQKQEFWETDDAEIVKLAQSLRTPRAIYNYVSSKLSYDYKRISENIDRLGAKKILVNPSNAICMEFTDLFIAIARAAGIPAREINGYAYTDNPEQRPLSFIADILHAWPEYYDDEKEMWIPIDPTWGNTTGGLDFFENLDLSHFGFVVHGISSKYPYAAGSYKQETDIGKDVDVKFSDILPKFLEVQPEVTLNLPNRIPMGTTMKGSIIMSNKTGQAMTNIPVNLGISGGKLSEDSFEVKILPPYSTRTLDFSILPDKNPFSFVTGNVWAQVGPKSYVGNYQVINFYTFIKPVIYLISIILSIGILFLLLRNLWKKYRK